MRINRGLLGWGVFFIVLGAVPIAVRGGVLDADVVRRAWELWPLILVGIGLGLVLERTRLAIAGGLVVAVTFGLMGGALIATGIGSPVNLSCGAGDDGRGGEPFAEQRGSFDGEARVRLEMNCGDLLVTTGADAGWTLAGRSRDGLPPDVSADASGLTVRAPSRPGIQLPGDAWRWDVTLSRSDVVAIDLDLNAGSANLDLYGLAVPRLDVSVNAGDAHVDLGDSARTQTVEGSVNAGSLALTLHRPSGILGGNLSVNAGSLELCVPAGTPIQLRVSDSPLGSNNFASRDLVRTGDTWSSANFDGAADAVQLRLSANLGSITLDPEDGCD